MDNRLVYRRTPKGDQEVSARTLPHEPWLTLVMVDGKATVGDLVVIKPELPQVIPSLDRLLREGFIEHAPGYSTPAQGPDAAGPDLLRARSEHLEKPRVKGDSSAVVGWIRRALFLTPAVAIVGGILFAYHSLDSYRDRIEGMLGKQGQSVSIRDTSYTFTPWPAVRFSDVSIGQDLTAAEIIVQPALASLLGRPAHITHLELRSATLTGGSLLAMLTGLRSRTAQEQFLVAHVTLNGGKLNVGSFVLAPLKGDLRYGAEGELLRATLSLEDGSAQATMQPQPSGLAVEFSAKHWSTPTDPKVTFERLDASGGLAGDRLVISRVDGLLNDGLLKGDFALDWGTSVAAEGRFSATNLELQSLIARFTREFSIGGRLDAQGTFRARAGSLPGLFENATVDAEFRVKRGVVYNADILTATRDKAMGGSTQFEELTGTVNMAGGAISFRHLQLGSGLITAKGALEVNPSRQLAGRFTVSLKGQGQGGGTISVGGSLREPALRPGG
jgi:hypothetical protein